VAVPAARGYPSFCIKWSAFLAASASKIAIILLLQRRHIIDAKSSSGAASRSKTEFSVCQGLRLPIETGQKNRFRMNELSR
jgi:hypothetical protein